MSNIEPSLMAAKRIEELEGALEVERARIAASGQMISELSQTNIELRAGTLLWQSRYEILIREKAKEIENLNKRIVENAPDAVRAEMDRLNRVIGVMDAEIARLLADVKKKEDELNAFLQEHVEGALLPLNDDGA